MSQQWSTPPAAEASATFQTIWFRQFSPRILLLAARVVAIIFAAQVNSKVAAGDIAGAMESSKKAKMFMFIAIGGGLLSGLCSIILWVFVHCREQLSFDWQAFQLSCYRGP